MRHLVRITIAFLTVATLASPAQATPLVRLNFDTPFVLDAGVSGFYGPFAGTEATLAGPWNAAGWDGFYGPSRFTGNPTIFSELSLSGLAPHTMISASFILGFLESWDSRDGTVTPDNLEIWIDGVQVASMTANNASGSINDFAGGTVIASYVQANSNLYFSDTLVNMGTAPFMTFAHSAPTLTIGIRASGAGWQGGNDEEWGIDDIRLDYDRDQAAVPEPGSMLLLGTGLAAAFVGRRFRRQ